MGVWHWARSQLILWFKEEGLNWRMIWGFLERALELSNSSPSFYMQENWGLRWCTELSKGSQKELVLESTLWVSWTRALSKSFAHKWPNFIYLCIYLCFLLTSFWKWRVSSRVKDQCDCLSEGLQVGLCPGDLQNAVSVAALLMGCTLNWPPTAVLVRKEMEGGRGASWTLEAGGGTWGSSCWLCELEKGLLACSCGLQLTCEELLPKRRSFENSPEGGGEETFKEEINKRGDRLLTLPKGALVYLWNFTPPLPLA